MAGLAGDAAATRRRNRLRFEDRMAIAAVLATLLGAIVAFVQSEAVKTSAAFGVRAQSLGVEAVEARAVASDAAELQYSRFLLLSAERRRLGNSWQAYLLGDRSAQLQIERLKDVAGQTISDTNTIAAGQSSALGRADLTGATSSLLGRPLCPITAPDSTPPPKCASSRNGPGQDVDFPRNYFADASWNAERLTALRDAALKRSSDREGQSVAYTITLSMFGVAIFLFGFTLTPQGRERARLFSLTATAMVAFALVYGAYEGLRTGGHGHDEAAAVHYADAIVAVGQADYPKAVRELAETIRLQPDFARAYYERALAIEALDSPVVSQGNSFSLVGTATLRQAIGDLRAAREHGLSLVDASNSLSADLAELGIRTRDRTKLEESAALARQTSQIDRINPTPELVRGLDLLALGRVGAASSAYRSAVTAIRATAPASRQERLVAGALTGLGLLGQRPGPRLAGQIRTLEESLVGLGRVVAPGTGSPRIDGLSIRVNPGTVGMTIAGQTGLQANRDVVSAQWYYQRPGAGGWSVVPAISGQVTLVEGADGKLSQSRSFLAVTTKAAVSGCLQPGRYRLDLYVNGRFAGAAETQLGLPALSPSFDREMNVALCLPPGFTRIDHVPGIPFGIESFPALVAVWTSRDRSEGAVMIRLNGQFGLKESGGNEPPGRSAQTVARAIRLWRGVFPAIPVPSRYVSLGTLSLSFTRGRGVNRQFDYPLPGSSSRGRGVVRTEANFNKNDLAVVVAAFGPEATAGLSRTILDSVTNALD